MSLIRVQTLFFAVGTWGMWGSSIQVFVSVLVSPDHLTKVRNRWVWGMWGYAPLIAPHMPHIALFVWGRCRSARVLSKKHS
jgi:hypothetical protein